MRTHILILFIIVVSGIGFANPGSHLPATPAPGTSSANRPSAGPSTSMEMLTLGELVNRLASESYRTRMAAELEIRRRLDSGAPLFGALRAIYTPGTTSGSSLPLEAKRRLEAIYKDAAIDWPSLLPHARARQLEDPSTRRAADLARDLFSKMGPTLKEKMKSAREADQAMHNERRQVIIRANRAGIPWNGMTIDSDPRVVAARAASERVQREAAQILNQQLRAAGLEIVRGFELEPRTDAVVRRDGRLFQLHFAETWLTVQQVVVRPGGEYQPDTINVPLRNMMTRLQVSVAGIRPNDNPPPYTNESAIVYASQHSEGEPFEMSADFGENNLTSIANYLARTLPSQASTIEATYRSLQQSGTDSPTNQGSRYLRLPTNR